MIQPDPSALRDYRWGTDCPVNTLRHWCALCRRGEMGHATPHTCTCGATDTSPTDQPERGGEAACGCPLRIDGTEPYLHLPGCPREGDLQVDRWLRERREVS